MHLVDSPFFPSRAGFKYWRQKWSQQLNAFFSFFSRNAKRFCLSQGFKDRSRIQIRLFFIKCLCAGIAGQDLSSLSSFHAHPPSSKYLFNPRDFPQTPTASASASPPSANSHVSISLHSLARTEEEEVQEFNTRGFPIILKYFFISSLRTSCSTGRLVIVESLTIAAGDFPSIPFAEQRETCLSAAPPTPPLFVYKVGPRADGSCSQAPDPISRTFSANKKIRFVLL